MDKQSINHVRTGQRSADSENFNFDGFQNFANPLRDLVQGSDNRPLAHYGRPLIEDYVKRAISLHFHLIVPEWMGEADKGSVGKYCVVLECPTLSDVLRYRCRINERRKREVESLYSSASEMKHAVLVEIGKFVEMPKWTGFSLPCRERLERFNQACSLISDPVQHIQAVNLKFGRTPKDRELKPTVFRGQAFVEKDIQLKHCMIECRTEVVEDFADCNPPHWVTSFSNQHPNTKLGQASDHFSSFSEVSSVELEMELVRVSIQESINLSLETLDIIAGSPKFKPDARYVVRSHINNLP